MKKSLKTRAFTLIEVLVVTSIVALLASITNAFLTEARKEAQDKKKIEESRQVNTALEIQRNKTGSVPSVSSGSYVAHNEKSSTYQNAMGELVTNGSMPEVPRSDTGKDYYYLVDDSGNGVFGAILESNASIEDNNGCYFTDPDVGCSGSNTSYATVYDRDSLILESDSCDSNCDGVGINQYITLSPNDYNIVTFDNINSNVFISTSNNPSNLKLHINEGNLVLLEYDDESYECFNAPIPPFDCIDVNNTSNVIQIDNFNSENLTFSVYLNGPMY